MRIDSASTQNLVAAAADLSARESNISSQISSGTRLQALSDDPAAAARAGELAASLQRTDAFLQSSSTVQNRLQATDAALGSTVTQLTSAISTAVAGEDATLTAQQRASAAQTLTGLRQSLLSLANSSYAGTYLFAGTAAAGPPFVQAANGSVTYAGDGQTSSLALVNGGSIPTNIPGSLVFTNGASSIFAALNSLIADFNGSGSPNPAAAVAQLRGALDNVTQQRQSLDGSLSRISDETSFQSGQKAQLQTEQTTLLGADDVALATQLSSTVTQRSALLSTIAAVGKGSIFDYLR